MDAYPASATLSGEALKNAQPFKKLEEEVEAREEDTSSLYQFISIPFEVWVLEMKHRVFIKLNEKQHVYIPLQIKQSIKNGEVIKFNGLQFVLNFNHRFYRRECYDIIYYIRENEVNKEYRDSVRHPNGSTFVFTCNDFNENKIIV